MYNPQLLNYLLDRSCKPKKTTKGVFNPKYDTNAINDYSKIKYSIILFTRIVDMAYKEFAKRLAKDTK